MKDQQRLNALYAYHILDTISEKEFDDIAQLAAIICETPMALINFVDENRVWIKSKVGLNISETTRDVSFCNHAIKGSEVMEIYDATLDARFSENPYVTDGPNIRFYAGAPLITPNGEGLGTVCVIAMQPKELTAEQKNALRILSLQVMKLLELRLQNLALQELKDKAEASARVLESFFDNSPAVGIVKDVANNTIIKATKKAEHAFKKPLDEINGHDLFDVISENEATRFTANEPLVLRDKVSINSEIEVEEKGVVSTYNTVSFPLFDSEDKLYAIAHLSNDITPRKKAERLTRESNERFTTVFESNPAGMAILDQESGIYLYANKRFLTTFGFEKDEVIGHSYNEIPTISAEKRKSLLLKFSASGYLQNHEISVTAKDGTILQCISSMEVIQIDQQKFVLTTFHDITQQKKLETELISARKRAENAAMIKQEFLANMSHEIRTPMNAIIGFASLLEKTKLNETQTEYLNAISSSGENLLTIINDILDFSKIEAGKLNIEKIDFNIHQLLQTVYTLFSNKMKEKGLEFVLHVDENIPEVVEGDPTRLNQVLTNLISNAYKFTHKGSITIDVCAKAFSDTSIQLYCSVKDTGIGIEQTKLQKIFERFDQADSSTTRQYGGTGLGLAIVEKLVLLQHGSIGVESGVGVGSNFYFDISYGIKQSISKDEAGTTNSLFAIHKNAYKHILLVEDNLLNQKLACAVLKTQGYVVEVAANGKNAISMLEKNSYDLILLDIQMPVLDGYLTTDYIRNNMQNTTPIIAMTAHVFTGEKTKCLSHGMNDYITKPFDEQELFNKIEKYTSSFENVCKTVQVEDAFNTVTNFTYLRQLAKGDDLLIQQMATIFLEQNPANIIKLEQAFAANDHEVVRAVTHIVRSSLSIFGIDKKALDMLYEMECKASQRQPLSSVAKYLPSIENICEQARAEVQNFTRQTPLNQSRYIA